MQLAPPVLVDLFGDDFYKGREQVLGFGYSNIVPKASPLRVRFRFDSDLTHGT